MNADTAPVRSRTARARLLGQMIGVVLLIAAIWAVASRREAVHDAWASLSAAPAWVIVLVLVLPAVNSLLTGLCFWTLSRRFGRVGHVEMQALIASSWLLSYVPMQPGLFGRVWYHKAVNHIPVYRSVDMVMTAIVSSAIAIGIAVPLALACTAAPGEHGPLFACLSAIGVVAALAGFAIPRANSRAGATAAAVLIKIIDTAAWSARYWLVYRAIGLPVTPQQAVAIAGVAQLVTLAPFVGNVPGLREWTVGLMSAWIPAWFAPASDHPMYSGMTADLTNRAMEICAAVPCGLAGLVYVWTKLRVLGIRPARGPTAASPDGPAPR